jgi:glucose/arabinose dehydrogenase
MINKFIYHTIFFFLGLTACKTEAQVSVNIVPYTTSIPNKVSELAHNGDGRMYACTQLGYIYIIEPGGIVNPTPFLNINSLVTPTTTSNTGEQGLLGLAFSPSYATDGIFYVYYTNKTGVGNSVLARYQVSSNPDSADPASAEILLTLTQPYTNHNGGCIRFGSDGYLYVALGDGGSGGDPGNRAQNKNVYFGKLLRLDVSAPGAYTIPATNPFFGQPNVKQEIWAYGLRNPWKYSFDRQTNDLWIADVGQGIWEEVNFQAAASSGGENYGWRCYEGLAVYDTSSGCGGTNTFSDPVHVYSHATTGGCSVTGGFVYRGSQFPDLVGYYFFADYCNGNIYALNPNGNTVNVAGTFTGKAFSTFGEDDNGELYVANLATGIVYRIVSTVTGIKNPEMGITSFIVLPNPVSESLNFQFKATNTSPLSMIVYSHDGKEVYTQKGMVISGENKFTINTKKFANGSYTLQLATAKGIIQKQFSVLK